jgi:ATP-dependent Lhr-like helicase
MVSDKTLTVLQLLSKPLREAVLERFGELTEPQLEAIPRILNGENLLLMAPTGTGKTEAALIPLLNRLLLENAVDGVRVIYITPLRALNRDLLERVEWWAGRLDMSVGVRHGDTAPRERRTQTLIPPTILITTPETLQIILTARVFRQHLRKVVAVVVDEVHELAGDKRGSQLSLALERLVELIGRDVQRIGLSATVGSPQRIASFLSGVGRACSVVRVPVSRMLQLRVEFPDAKPEDYELAERLSVHPEVAARLNLIKSLVDSHESTLVFTNTRPLAEILTNRFRAWDEAAPIGIHHGSLSKSTRVGAEQALKTGGLSGVVCTSSLEMGIDVGRIELCIQYNSPREVTRLVQRVGRSGHRIRGVAKGVVLVTDSDDALESLVIARRALNDLIEDVQLFENSYDVLAHQLAGVLIERKEVALEEVLKVFRRSYCFRDLTLEDLRKTAAHLERLGAALLTSDGKLSVGKTTALYDYYFNNISMIPDEKQYLVIKENTGEPVGILDEEFVAEHGEPGTRFILMGRAWEIIQAAGQRIYVAELDSLEGAVPSWVGEEIPVPFEVAQEVGAIRRRYAEALMAGSEEEVVEALANEFFADRHLIRKSLREVRQHHQLNLPIPSDSLVLLEETPEYLFLHVCGGLRANRTISRLIAYLVSEMVGLAVTVQQDPYRIVFKAREMTAEHVVEAIKRAVSMPEPESVVRRAVEASTLFRRRLVHVARKMGVVSKEASILDVSAMKLAEMLKGTVVYEEALNHSLTADYDLATAMRLLRGMASEGGLVTIRVEEPTPLAKLSIQRYASDVDMIAAERLQRLVVNAVRGRLNNEAVTLVCTTCWNWYRHSLVRDVEQSPACQSCGSQLLGVVKEGPEQVLNLLARRGRPANRNERMLRRSLIETAKLVEKYGKAAVFTLASKYLTTKDAEEVLKRETSLGVRLVEIIIDFEKKRLQEMFR